VTSVSLVFPQPSAPSRTILENISDFLSFGNKHFGPSVCCRPLFQTDSTVAFLLPVE
jgi:hypothetical protein